jgi:hypothetical protein
MFKSIGKILLPTTAALLSSTVLTSCLEMDDESLGGHEIDLSKYLKRVSIPGPTIMDFSEIEASKVLIKSDIELTDKKSVQDIIDEIDKKF